MSNVIEHPTRHIPPHWQIQAIGAVALMVQDEVSQMTTVDELTDLGSCPPGGPKNGVKLIASIAGRPESEVTEDQAMNVWVDGVLLAGQSIIDSSPAAGDESGCHGDTDPAWMISVQMARGLKRLTRPNDSASLDKSTRQEYPLLINPNPAGRGKMMHQLEAPQHHPAVIRSIAAAASACPDVDSGRLARTFDHILGDLWVPLQTGEGAIVVVSARADDELDGEIYQYALGTGPVTLISDEFIEHVTDEADWVLFNMADSLNPDAIGGIGSAVHDCRNLMAYLMLGSTKTGDMQPIVSKAIDTALVWLAEESDTFRADWNGSLVAGQSLIPFLVLTKKSMVAGWLPADAPVPRRLAA